MVVAQLCIRAQSCGVTRPFRRVMTTATGSGTAPKARWWMPGATAVVTGANKGIGFDIARRLAEEGFAVKLTARTDTAGSDAVARLTKAVPQLAAPPAYYLLDQRDPASVEALGAALECDCPAGVDLLICNAGLAFPEGTLGAGEALESIAVNYTGTALVCERLMPLMLASAAASSGAKPRIVTVCSGAGKLDILSSEATRRRFDESKTRAEVDALMAEFVQSIRDGTHEELFCNDLYGMSKLGMAVYTRVLARELGEHALVTAVCPGYCATDLTVVRDGQIATDGYQSSAVGADTPVWAALLPAETATGQFFSERTPQPF
mmetsp:Transcript_12639/g.30498  ORF Transcript_12639/g.30498 Transcript_12639/m.30498 type:complete len:321 (+) Transcript_12639:166-1128(+)